jgi:hypothetical protein
LSGRICSRLAYAAGPSDTSAITVSINTGTGYEVEEVRKPTQPNFRFDHLKENGQYG